MKPSIVSLLFELLTLGKTILAPMTLISFLLGIGMALKEFELLFWEVESW